MGLLPWRPCSTPSRARRRENPGPPVRALRGAGSAPDQGQAVGSGFLAVWLLPESGTVVAVPALANRGDDASAAPRAGLAPPGLRKNAPASPAGRTGRPSQANGGFPPASRGSGCRHQPFGVGGPWDRAGRGPRALSFCGRPVFFPRPIPAAFQQAHATSAAATMVCCVPEHFGESRGAGASSPFNRSGYPTLDGGTDLTESTSLTVTPDPGSINCGIRRTPVLVPATAA